MNNFSNQPKSVDIFPFVSTAKTCNHPELFGQLKGTINCDRKQKVQYMLLERGVEAVKTVI